MTSAGGRRCDNGSKNLKSRSANENYTNVHRASCLAKVDDRCRKLTRRMNFQHNCCPRIKIPYVGTLTGATTRNSPAVQSGYTLPGKHLW